MIKAVSIKKIQYVFLFCLFTVVVFIGVFFPPAFSMKLFEFLGRETQTYMDFLQFIDVFICICLIVFIIAGMLSILMALFFYYNIVKFKVVSAMCYVLMGTMLLIFIGSLVYLASAKNLNLGVGAYLLWGWIAGYFCFALLIKPVR